MRFFMKLPPEVIVFAPIAEFKGGDASKH